MRSSTIYALAASISTAAAASQGFNYGATKSDGTFNYQSDYESLFSSAKNLVGTNNGFTSARLYTMIQGGSSTNEPTEAIPAAIKEGTTLLLGLWASGGQGPFSAEITALKSAISQYGDDFAKLVVGISVGSEDLYRDSPTGQAANAGLGADALTVSSYLVQLKEAVAGTSLSEVPIGHVDTWTAWAESTDANLDLVVGNCSFIGMDAYPYFQNTMANSITDGKSLFNAALAATKSATGGKPVWITETGFPVSGKTENLAVPGLKNAKTYWDEVGCPNFGSVNTWWYTLQDTNPVTPNPSFGVIGSSYGTTPLYDLSCSDVSSGSSSSSKSSTATKTSSAGGSSDASASASYASVASSLVAAASSGAVVSSGSGLSPSIGAGNGVSASVTGTGSGSSPTGASGSNSTVTVGTLSSSGFATATSSGSSTSTSAGVVSTNAASVLTGSFVGAMGALMVAVAAL